MKLIKDNWKPQICNSNKEFPYLIVDNWYNKEEEKLIECVTIPQEEDQD